MEQREKEREREKLPFFREKGGSKENRAEYKGNGNERGAEGSVRIIRRRDSAGKFRRRGLSCVGSCQRSVGRARHSLEQRFYASFHADNLRKIIDVKLTGREAILPAYREFLPR